MLSNTDNLNESASERSLLLENSIDDKSTETQTYDERQKVRVPGEHSTGFSLRKLWAFTGPGFLMSIAYLDPGNIESDLQAGAVARYNLLWVLLWSTVAGLVLQLLAARLGVVTGKHLAEVCREKYPKVPRLMLWVFMELAIIGSDIQEVIGSAVAIQLLSNGKIPLWGGALMTGIDTFTFLFLENYGLRKLEAFFAALITTMSVTFGYMYIASGPPQDEVVKRVFIPGCTNCTSDVAEQAVGILGAVIMPHNIYLHSALVLSREINRDKESAVKEGILYNSIESAIALTVSFVINLFVVCVFAKMFYPNPNITLVSAGNELKNYGCHVGHHNSSNASVMSMLVSNSTTAPPSTHCSRSPFWIIWGIGLLAAGQSSTMTGTYAGQFVMEGFLGIKWPRWKRVLLTRSIAMVPTVLCATVFASYLDILDELLNVEQSLLLPFALLPILHLTNSRRVMGQFKNKWWMTAIVWFLGLVVMGVNGYLVISQTSGRKIWEDALTGILFPVYVVIVMYYCLGPSLVARIQDWIWANVVCHIRALCCKKDAQVQSLFDTESKDGGDS